MIIIGGGPGGYDTAALAAQNGLQTVLIEASHLGGACLNEGCIPTKCLCRSAEAMQLAAGKAAELGLKIEGVSLDFARVMERKREVVATLTAGISSMLKSAGVEVVIGRATLRDAHTATVGEEEYTAPSVIIATGATTKFLPIEGAHLDGVLTSRELLEADSVPESLCIIGGGVIGLEFASIFSSFGTKVSVVEFLPEILPAFDRDLAKRLRIALRRKGVDFHVNSAAQYIHRTDAGFSVGFASRGSESSIEAASVFMAVGRAAALDSLDFADVGIATSKRGVEVDDDFQTSVKGVYAVGDINGRAQLAHVARAQGRHALMHILGRADDVDFSIVPAAVFTSPELAMVGPTEEQLKVAGTEYRTCRAAYRANGKALAEGEGDGVMKILVSPSGKVLGAHALGLRASELIHEVAAFISMGCGLDDIKRMIHAHPTLNEIVLSAAEAAK